ncbi:PHP domain-containing protein [Anaerorhabdus furcosa]|uniref:Polymerase/histidinol phosphatase N-terminal domain-containing protein n=1 Tax=Anaerorhabdus furcosa TaxID=118967 RepID=A0A1T4MUA8_9FIRM|nr:PHP domain-containing protein [Anaerorhabdus furcosa]SJZ70424.1 hypothetical protein SAMN02745191_1411 [Anaerorhabdus furcosa]
MKVDLHIHSFYSDGTLSPREIVDEAIKNQVGYMSLTDHNQSTGCKEMMELAQEAGITCIPGAEVDTLEQGVNYHVLAYGYDLDDIKFKKYLNDVKRKLDEVSEKLIIKMEKDYSEVSLKEFNKYTYDPKLGGWKALHYFVDKGLASDISESFGYYFKYNHTYESVDFPPINEVCTEIHHAGGKAILAHPGKVIKTDDLAMFEKQLRQIIDSNDLDGIECYYPSHSEEITQICLSICNEKDLMITCGNDCHGSFEKTTIGQLDITMDKLKGIDK